MGISSAYRRRCSLTVVDRRSSLITTRCCTRVARSTARPARAGVVLPGWPVRLALVLFMVLTCGRDPVTVVNVSQHLSASDGLATAWGGLLTAWPDHRIAKSKRLVGRCRSVPLTCASCRPASLSPGLRRPAWLYQWLYSQAVSGHTQLPWKINVFFSTWGILVPASSCGWEPCSHPMPQTSPSGRGGTPRLR
jgi:hypothetical protein